MRQGALVALGAAALAGPAPAQAQITLQLVEVITSPQRTEVVQSLVDQFEEANPGVNVEITSLPWGQAFEKLATMVQGGQIPDVVEMPDRWMALYANNDQLVDLGPYMESWANADQLNERTVEFGSVVNDTMYMVPYGFYLRAMFWNKKLFGEAGLDGPPETMDEFMEASKKISELGGGKAGYCLRGGPGGANGYIMMMLNMMGHDDYFDAEGNSNLNSPDAIKGLQFLDRPVPERLRAAGQRQLGLQRDRRRLLLRHLRHAGSGSRRADRDRRADGPCGLRSRADAARAGWQVLPDHRLRRLVDVRGRRSTRTRPGS